MHVLSVNNYLLFCISDGWEKERSVPFGQRELTKKGKEGIMANDLPVFFRGFQV